MIQSFQRIIKQNDKNGIKTFTDILVITLQRQFIYDFPIIHICPKKLVHIFPYFSVFSAFYVFSGKAKFPYFPVISVFFRIPTNSDPGCLTSVLGSIRSKKNVPPGRGHVAWVDHRRNHRRLFNEGGGHPARVSPPPTHPPTDTHPHPKTPSPFVKWFTSQWVIFDSASLRQQWRLRCTLPLPLSRRARCRDPSWFVFEREKNRFVFFLIFPYFPYFRAKPDFRIFPYFSVFPF